MIHSRPSRLRVLLVTLIVSAALVLVQARRADANPGYGAAGLVLLVAAAVTTYATVMGVACTPVAAAKASDYPGGFSTAFKDCFTLEMIQSAPGEDNESDRPPEAEEANRNEDDHQEE